MKEKQRLVLQSALPIVPFDGWSNSVVEQASLNAGFEKRYVYVLFPGGVSELVDFFMRDLDNKMSEKVVYNDNFNNLKIREKIAFLVKSRLEISNEHRLAIQKTVIFYSLPQNIFCGTSSLWKTVDFMWYLAGDKSTDYNYYTKRTLLAAVYSSTLLYWLNDKSDNHNEAWEFLNRRIENIMLINKVKYKVFNRE